MMDELFYIVALDDKKAAIKSTLQADKVMFSTREDLYKMASEAFIGGVINGGFYPCLFSKKLEKFYSEYYYVSPKRLYHLTSDREYVDMHARIVLPVCSIFATASNVIVAKENNACVTTLECNTLGFTGLTFSYAVFDHKLFLHEQSFKVFSDGLYFVNNIITVLKNDMSLQYVYKTPLQNAVHLEKKYNLRAQSSSVILSDRDKQILHELQLFDLRVAGDCLFLDDTCIVSGKDKR